MKDIGSLSHSRWECKYHVVFIPKYRRKVMYRGLREHLGKMFHELARQRECKIEQGHLCPDHVHMLISIPPKYSVAQVVGFIKGKSAIAIARTYVGRRQNFSGQNFWARGYYVSTVGRDEAVIRAYIGVLCTTPQKGTFQNKMRESHVKNNYALFPYLDSHHLVKELCTRCSAFLTRSKTL